MEATQCEEGSLLLADPHHLRKGSGIVADRVHVVPSELPLHPRQIPVVSRQENKFPKWPSA